MECVPVVCCLRPLVSLKVKMKMLEEEQDMSSVMDYSGLGTNQEIDDEGSVLPGYVPYLLLVLKLIATTVILLMSSWVLNSLSKKQEDYTSLWNNTYLFA